MQTALHRVPAHQRRVRRPDAGGRHQLDPGIREGLHQRTQIIIKIRIFQIIIKKINSGDMNIKFTSSLTVAPSE